MTKIRIFTDPHLGLSRQAHTTRESSARLKQELYNQAMAIVEDSPHPSICVGDLFDKANNPETTLVQGYNVASRCKKTLSGNHDELNREGVLTSLAALQDMGVAVCAAPNLSTAYFEVVDECLYMVPHHASQELFVEACYLAASNASRNREGKASYLFLHCNYNFGMAIEDNTLNLSSATADDLLGAFDYIFIGHEHNPSVHKNGKVVVLGNTMPTSFSDISDKFTYDLTLETAQLSKELVWAKDVHYREIKLGSEIPDLQGVQFVDVVGLESVANATEVSQFIREIWKAAESQPAEDADVVTWATSLIAVRNRVEIRDSLQDVATDAAPVALDDLKTRIQADLKGSDLEPLFTELLSEVSR